MEGGGTGRRFWATIWGPGSGGHAHERHTCAGWALKPPTCQHPVPVPVPSCNGHPIAWDMPHPWDGSTQPCPSGTHASPEPPYAVPAPVTAAQPCQLNLQSCPTCSQASPVLEHPARCPHEHPSMPQFGCTASPGPPACHHQTSCPRYAAPVPLHSSLSMAQRDPPSHPRDARPCASPWEHSAAPLAACLAGRGDCQPHGDTLETKGLQWDPHLPWHPSPHPSCLAVLGLK